MGVSGAVKLLHPYELSPSMHDYYGWDMNEHTADPSRIFQLCAGAGAGFGAAVAQPAPVWKLMVVAPRKYSVYTSTP